MKKPKMILFDYGQTLVNEARYDAIRGTEAVLQYATENKYNLSAKQVQKRADELNQEMGRFAPLQDAGRLQIELPNRVFAHYLYESLGIKVDLSPEEIDAVFWNAEAPGKPTEGIQDFLDFLSGLEIRTGVISNIPYAGQVVEDKIRRFIPEHRFEFIIASSDYVFCKPNPRIFHLAMEKAGLSPEDVWYVGDNYDCDVLGARNAGIFPVWYVGAMRGRYKKREDVMVIAHWEQLKAYICACSK